MNRTLTYHISETEQGFPINRYLKSLGYSSRNLAELKKKTDSVLLNGESVFLNHPLGQGDVLTIRIREEVSSEKIPPVELPLSIVYEDEDLMVINKPAGMPIHPSMNNYKNSLGNALAWYFARQDKPFVFRCINRLDRDTSGLTIVAKHMVSAGILSAMVAAKGRQRSLLNEQRFPDRERIAGNTGIPDITNNAGLSGNADLSGNTGSSDNTGITREYLAIVRGKVTPSSGTVSAPLSRREGSLLERQVDFQHGEKAITHYRVIKEKNGHSLISLQLETGRTHQIRVHMKYLGYPLIGDYLYNPDMEYINRQALHSWRLRFLHPITREQMEFTAPLPEDMENVLR